MGVILAQLIGAVMVTVAAASTASELTAGGLGWGAASGIGSGLGTAFLYRGLGGGR